MTVMQWLTREWVWGHHDDATSEALLEACRAHHRLLAPALPEALRRFATNRDDSGYLSLHDARPEWWSFDHLATRLTLAVVAGDDAIGYRRLVIQYCEAEVIGASIGQVGAWLDALETVLLWNEVDALDDGRFEHRHLLEPEGEFGVRFESVVVISAPVDGSVEGQIIQTKRLLAHRNTRNG